MGSGREGVKQQGGRAGHHRVAPEVPPNGPSSEPLPAMADTDSPGAPISGLAKIALIDGPRRRPDHCADQRDTHRRVDEDGDALVETALEGLRGVLADHVSGNVDRAVAAVAPGEGLTRCHQPDDPGETSTLADIRDLEREVALTPINQDDQSGERPGGEGFTAEKVAPAPSPYWSGPSIGQWAPPTMVGRLRGTRRRCPPGVSTWSSGSTADGMLVWATESAEGVAPGVSRT